MRKDGNWERPDPLVKDFYEWGIELILMFPGWETFFNIGADFLLYDTARLPVFRYLVPAFLQLLHDFVYMNLKGIKSTTGEITRRVINISIDRPGGIGLHYRLLLGWIYLAFQPPL